MCRSSARARWCMPATSWSPTMTAFASCRVPPPPMCSKKPASAKRTRNRSASGSPPASSASTSMACVSASPGKDSPMSEVRAMWMRGGTSKGGFFLADDLPADIAERDAFLLRAYGSPDLRQVDGMGGADPLTSKVAVVSASTRAGVDVEYLFLQVAVDKAVVSDAQNCGNMLAGVAPFAMERG